MSMTTRQITRLLKKDRKKLDGFLTELGKFLDTEGLRLLGYVRRRTPVDTGYLRQNWQVDRTGLAITLSNITFYAAFVEYGHRQGRGFVPGFHMAQKSIEREQRELIGRLGTWLHDYFTEG